MLTSPYLRARDTADAVRNAGGLTPADSKSVVDERLREKEFGILDRLTRLGIEQRHPELGPRGNRSGILLQASGGGELVRCDPPAEKRIGYDQPALPRKARADRRAPGRCPVHALSAGESGRSRILAIDAEGDVANCAVTEYRLEEQTDSSAALKLEKYNLVAPLEEARTPVTSAPDLSVAAR